MPTNYFIDNVLRTYSKFYKGTFSANTIPTKLSELKRFSIVCNLSDHNEAGSHFVCIIKLNNELLYIDSLGLPCLENNISSFLCRNRVKLFHNNAQFQDFKSDFCSLYCIMFVLYFENDLSMNVTTNF